MFNYAGSQTGLLRSVNSENQQVCWLCQFFMRKISTLQRNTLRLQSARRDASPKIKSRGPTFVLTNMVIISEITCYYGVFRENLWKVGYFSSVTHAPACLRPL